MLATLVRHACARLGFTRAVVLVRSGPVWDGVRDDGTVEVHFHVSDQPAPLVDEAWSSGTPDARARGRRRPARPRAPRRRATSSSRPITADGEHLGVAVGEWGGGNDARIPTSTVRALAQASMHAALAFRNARLLGENERLATRDSLTGLANRRLFDESLQREVARAQRLATPLSLLVLDVDHFKQVNDTYGHQTGDAVLREVADALVANTKNYDVAARYGGDEFVVLLPGCSRDDALRVAERVRHGIARAVGEAPVTISAGVATVPDNATDAERLMAAADAALYDAKRTGRDRVAGSGRNIEVVPPTPLSWTRAARTRRLSARRLVSSPRAPARRRAARTASARSSLWWALPAAERWSESTNRNRRGDLVARQLGAAPRQHLGLVEVVAVGDLHQRDDPLAEALVGDADHDAVERRPGACAARARPPRGTPSRRRC